jgi:hypothetical protein
MASVRHNHKALCRSGGKLFPPNLDLAFATVGWLTPISAIKVWRQVTGSREAQDGYSGRAMADGRADRDLAARACRLDRKCVVSYARHRRDLRSIQPVASAEISPIANNPGWFRTFVTVKNYAQHGYAVQRIELRAPKRTGFLPGNIADKFPTWKKPEEWEDRLPNAD